MNPAAYAVVGTLFFALGIGCALGAGNILRVLTALGIAFLGPVIAFAGFAASGGGGVFPPYGEAVGVFLVLVAGAELLVAVAVAIVIWRHEAISDIDDLDEVAA